MDNIICLECDYPLLPHAQVCACGWRKKEEIKKMDYRCAYVVQEKRCRAEGRISRSIKAKGNWYCLQHWNIY
jgi:hypothetical protein